MLPLLLGAIVLAPPYWLLVPARYHRTAITVASLAALAACDRRLLGLVLGVAVAGVRPRARSVWVGQGAVAGSRARGVGMAALVGAGGPRPREVPRIVLRLLPPFLPPVGRFQPRRKGFRGALRIGAPRELRS